MAPQLFLMNELRAESYSAEEIVADLMHFMERGLYEKFE